MIVDVYFCFIQITLNGQNDNFVKTIFIHILDRLRSRVYYLYNIHTRIIIL